MPARRLPAPLLDGLERGRPVRFRHDGRWIEAFESEPVAVALLAAGQPVLSRSFRFHRPRGLMCSTGQCGWCELEVDGLPSARSCRVAVRDGLRTRSEHSWPSAGRDLFALLDVASRWIPPTFYHHRFLRPLALRRRYLDVIRLFGGRGRVTPGARVIAKHGEAVVEADVVVVGGGLAGMLAAASAAGAGGHVALLEAEDRLGGAWRWRAEVLPDGTSLDARAAELAGHGRVRLLLGSAVIGWYGQDLIASGPQGATRLRARAVVAATGSYERLPSLPGNDRPGVLGASTVEWLINGHGVVPGDRAALVGDAAQLRWADLALRRAGAEVLAAMPAEQLRGIHGRDRVRSVSWGAGASRRAAVELLVIGDRQPALELTLAAGAKIEARGSLLLPIVDDDGTTSAPGFFVAGGTAGRPIVDEEAMRAALRVGTAAGRATRASAGTVAAADWRESAGPARAAVRMPAPRAIPASALVCPCEDVHGGEIAAELAAGFGDPELVKRRTGAVTGPCQGKYCLPGFAAAVGANGSPCVLPTARPPTRPVRLGELAAPILDGVAER